MSDQKELSLLLRVEQSFDLVAKKLSFGNRRAVLYFVDGLIKDELLERILAFLLSLKPSQLTEIKTAPDFAASFVPYTYIY